MLQLPCGVVFFLHISKCGGGSVKQHLQLLSRKGGWRFFDHFRASFPYCRGARSNEPWNTSSLWRSAMQELAHPKPKLMIHYHT